MTAGSPAITVSKVSLSFGGLRVLNEMSMTVKEGEIVGLIGPNGCGKTSLLNCINRVYRPDQGSIELFGRSLGDLRPDQVAKLGLARTFQATTAFRNTTVKDLVLVGRHVRLGSGFWSCLIGLPSWRGYERAETAHALRFIEFVGLRNVADYDVSGLSYGTAKLADIARALASEPRVLLLDEPASGLSRSARVWIAGLIRRIRSDLGVTLVIIEHDMALVSRVCDRVVVMRDGAAFADGAPATTLADQAVVGSLMGMREVPSTDASSR